MDQRVLRWFGHVGRMDEYHSIINIKVSMVEVSGGGWVWGRQRLHWMAGMKVIFGSKEIEG